MGSVTDRIRQAAGREGGLSDGPPQQAPGLLPDEAPAEVEGSTQARIRQAAGRKAPPPAPRPTPTLEKAPGRPVEPSGPQEAPWEVPGVAKSLPQDGAMPPAPPAPPRGSPAGRVEPDLLADEMDRYRVAQAARAVPDPSSLRGELAPMAPPLAPFAVPDPLREEAVQIMANSPTPEHDLRSLAWRDRWSKWSPKMTEPEDGEPEQIFPVVFHPNDAQTAWFIREDVIAKDPGKWERNLPVSTIDDPTGEVGSLPREYLHQASSAGPGKIGPTRLAFEAASGQNPFAAGTQMKVTEMTRAQAAHQFRARVDILPDALIDRLVPDYVFGEGAGDDVEFGLMSQGAVDDLPTEGLREQLEDRERRLPGVTKPLGTHELPLQRRKNLPTPRGVSGGDVLQVGVDVLDLATAAAAPIKHAAGAGFAFAGMHGADLTADWIGVPEDHDVRDWMMLGGAMTSARLGFKGAGHLKAKLAKRPKYDMPKRLMDKLKPKDRSGLQKAARRTSKDPVGDMFKSRSEAQYRRRGARAKRQLAEEAEAMVHDPALSQLGDALGLAREIEGARGFEAGGIAKAIGEAARKVGVEKAKKATAGEAKPDTFLVDVEPIGRARHPLAGPAARKAKAKVAKEITKAVEAAVKDTEKIVKEIVKAPEKAKSAAAKAKAKIPGRRTVPIDRADPAGHALGGKLKDRGVVGKGDTILYKGREYELVGMSKGMVTLRSPKGKTFVARKTSVRKVVKDLAPEKAPTFKEVRADRLRRVREAAEVPDDRAKALWNGLHLAERQALAKVLGFDSKKGGNHWRFQGSKNRAKIKAKLEKDLGEYNRGAKEVPKTAHELWWEETSGTNRTIRLGRVKKGDILNKDIQPWSKLSPKQRANVKKAYESLSDLERPSRSGYIGSGLGALGENPLREMVRLTKLSYKGVQRLLALPDDKASTAFRLLVAAPALRTANAIIDSIPIVRGAWGGVKVAYRGLVQPTSFKEGLVRPSDIQALKDKGHWEKLPKFVQRKILRAADEGTSVDSLTFLRNLSNVHDLAEHQAATWGKSARNVLEPGRVRVPIGRKGKAIHLLRKQNPRAFEDAYHYAEAITYKDRAARNKFGERLHPAQRAHVEETMVRMQRLRVKARELGIMEDAVFGEYMDGVLSRIYPNGKMRLSGAEREKAMAESIRAGKASIGRGGRSEMEMVKSWEYRQDKPYVELKMNLKEASKYATRSEMVTDPISQKPGGQGRTLFKFKTQEAKDAFVERFEKINMKSKIQKTGNGLDLAQRKKYGEFFDYRLSGEESIAYMETRVAQAEAFKKAANNPEISAGGNEASGAFTQRIPFEPGKYGKLAGRWVTDTTYDGVMRVGRVLPDGLKFWLELRGLWKMGKVTLSPRAHPRQIFGNMLAGPLMGIRAWNPLDVPYFIQALTDMAAKNKRWENGIKLGLGLGTTYVAEIGAKGLSRAVKLGEIRTVGDIVRYLSRNKLTKTAGALYGFGDAWPRYAAWLKNMHARKMDSGRAAQEVHKVAPNYAEVGEGLAAASNTPGFGTFVRFRAEVTKSFVNAAVEHPWRLAEYMALPYFIDQLSRRFLGISDEEAAAHRDLHGYWRGYWPDPDEPDPIDLGHIGWGYDILRDLGIGRRAPDLGEDPPHWFERVSDFLAPWVDSPEAGFAAALAGVDMFVGREVKQVYESEGEARLRAAYGFLLPDWGPGGRSYKKWKQYFLSGDRLWKGVDKRGDEIDPAILFSDTLAGVIRKPFRPDREGEKLRAMFEAIEAEMKRAAKREEMSDDIDAPARADELFRKRTLLREQAADRIETIDKAGEAMEERGFER